MKELTTFCSELSKKATEQNGEIVHLRQILDELESVGNINGSILYKTKNTNSLLPLILEENRRKNKHNEEAAASLE
jgi:ferric iron reductase protein FhuF